MNENEIYQRIKSRLKALNMSERQASLQAAGNAELIRNIRRGKSMSPRSGSLMKLAKVLGVSESWILGTSGDIEASHGEHEPGIRYGGIVEAGAFRRVDLLDQEGEHRIIPIASDPRFPAAAQAAWKAEGDSMTEAGIFPGMYILAVEAEAYERRLGEPHDGKLVIVEQTRDGDPEREITVKRLRIFRDRIELQPESKNPRHQPIVFPRQVAEDQPLSARVIAVVLQAVRVY